MPEPKPATAPALLLACLFLAGCAASPAPARPAPPAAPRAGAPRTGTVVAVRQIDLAPGDGSRAGIDAVLAALRQPPSPAALALQEIVVEEADGPVALAGAFPNIAAGNRVGLGGGQLTIARPGG